MKRMCWTLIALAMVGCSVEPGQQAHRLLLSERPSLLTIRSEMHMSGLSGSETWLGPMNSEAPTIIEHNDSLSSDRYWHLLELPLQAFPTDEQEHVRVKMTVRRVAEGYGHRSEEFGSSSESFDSDDPAPIDPSDRSSWDALVDMKALRFDATVNRAGRLVSIDPHGEQFDQMRQSLAKAKAEGVGPAEIEQHKAALHLHSLGVFSGLEDISAYLPPDDVAVGSRWAVRREHVYPYRGFEFYVMTSGCVYSTERSTCRVTAVEQSPTGRSITVAISGRRLPQGPETEERVDYLEMNGLLRVNVDTWESAEFYMGSDVRWLNPGAEPMGVRFMERVMLSPMTP